MSKDSVRKRISGEDREGMSFTEFTYQLVQGYDFYVLYTQKSCKLQMGGSDQWGNITTGTELIRRKCGGEAYALTCPLITKADGGKFGKTETGNVWLDPARTSPYQFYQFWMNVSDADARKYIRIFTMLGREEIGQLEQEQDAQPHLRPLQKALAREVTCMVHSQADWMAAEEASQMLFGAGTAESLARLDEATFLSVFGGVPRFEIPSSLLHEGIALMDLLCTHTQVFPSRGEARRTLDGGGISVNKQKVTSVDTSITSSDLINQKYILVQKGKKNYFVIQVQ
jgi:tyrosyl-tRNA synthetase